jgi:pimeloyl-ACP methyl ester carboxylesterase
MTREDDDDAWEAIMTATKAGLIEAGTIKLYHEVRGSGPALLLVSSRGGDAGQWMRVAPTLAEEFTVVTYDRRGHSRSPRPDGWTATSVAEHAEDAAALLRALDLVPAVVVGHSSGASITCSLVADQPEVVRHAVIYEAPLLAVVPGGQEIVAGARAATQQAMAEDGPRRAMEVFMRGDVGDEVSIDPTVHERMLDNGAVFFQLELPAFSTFVPDREAMRASGVPLTVVVGEGNRDTWFEAAAAWLAEGTEAERHELPGRHAGFWSHPEEFVELVRRIAR